MLRNFFNGIKQDLVFAKSHPKEWATESTTMFGVALMVLGAWLEYTKALSTDQAYGIIVVGSGLLYPQSSTKQNVVANLVVKAVEMVSAGKPEPNQNTETK